MNKITGLKEYFNKYGTPTITEQQNYIYSNNTNEHISSPIYK